MDLHNILTQLQRPRILVKAARLGLTGYNRNKDLLRIASGTYSESGVTSDHRLVDRLISLENEAEEARISGEASYNIQRHIVLLTAVLAEARKLLRNRDALV